MNVKEIQTALIALGYAPGPLDGKTGPKTRAAVEAFQSQSGLVVDGIAGPQTQTALKRAATPAKPGRPEPNKSAMAEIIFAAPISDVSGVAVPPLPAILSTARPINEVIIHCAATPEGKDFTVADIRAWHKARGWDDIGYHYVVYRDGRVMLGRPVGQVGAHVEGHNTGTVGISYVGGVSADGKTAKDTRTPAQRAALLAITRALIGKFPAVRWVTGHNQYAAKACPSFDVRRDPLGALFTRT